MKPFATSLTKSLGVPDRKSVGEVIEKDTSDAPVLVPGGDVKVVVAPFLVFCVAAHLVPLAHILVKCMEVTRVLLRQVRTGAHVKSGLAFKVQSAHLLLEVVLGFGF